MIRVSIDTDELMFKLDGHAGYAPMGQDIVCASASMLTATLFQRVLDLVDDADLGDCEMEPGHASLDVVPASTSVAASCRHAFETVYAGFRLLAERYPDNIIID